MADENGQVSDFVISLSDFDASLLPADARTPGTDAFQKAVSDHFTKEFARFGGWVQIVIDTQVIRVSWRSDPNAPDPVTVLAERLQRGDHEEPVRLLEMLRTFQPDNVAILSNLGMALSDIGQLDRAEKYLLQALAIEPETPNLWTSLGVALARQEKNDAAIEAFRQALARDSNDPYAHRNLGACLILAGALQEAEQHLRKAVELSPKDQQAVFGLAEALHATGKPKEADARYAEVIDLDTTSDVAEAARDQRRKLAQQSFRATRSGLRPDAVMYCVDAMRRFKKMPWPEVQKITFEIAVLGQRGLDTNDPSPQYTVKSMPGNYSGLQLVCCMYVGFKIVTPEHDIGFDLSKEYEAAKAMAE